MHFCAGLSPDLTSMEQIRRIMRPTDVPDQGRSICYGLTNEPANMCACSIPVSALVLAPALCTLHYEVMNTETEGSCHMVPNFRLLPQV